MTKASLIRPLDSKRATGNHARVSKKCFVCGKVISASKALPKAKRNPKVSIGPSNINQRQNLVKSGPRGFDDLTTRQLSGNKE